MDVLDSLMAAAEIRSTLNMERRASTEVIQWREASSSRRPAIVFIPGFLSERDSMSDFGCWTKQIVSFAKKQNWAAYGLYWPSMLRADIISSVNWGNLFGEIAMAGRIRPFSSLFETSVTELFNIKRVWQKAVQNADSLGWNSDKWLSSLHRPVILIGHSLGGRIALQAAMSNRRAELLQVSVFAPAILASGCDFRRIQKRTQKKGAIFHSQNDTTLRYLFRAGELTAEAPLGLEGVPQNSSGWIRSVDVSRYRGRRTRHNDYAAVCMELAGDFL